MPDTSMNDGSLRRDTAQDRDRSLSEIAGELWGKTEILVRQEIELARTQLAERAQALKDELKLAATAGAMLYVGVLSLTAAAILLLCEWLEPWLAAFIVGAGTSGFGYLLGRREPQRMATAATAEDVKPHAEQNHPIVQARR